VQYDVTTFTGNYYNNTSKFALPPLPGVMPWWGSSSLASQMLPHLMLAMAFFKPFIRQVVMLQEVSSVLLMDLDPSIFRRTMIYM
jgi:hypothetical protein